MIAIGGVIGAGFFVGSGVVIRTAGPAAFLTYVLCGVLIILVMRMLGEMATANPSTGSFADYAREALGGWAGFSVGWLYWYYWVIVVGFEAVAGAKVVNYWVHAPLWLVSLILMLTMTATNLFSVSSYRGIRILVRRNQSRDHRVIPWPRHDIRSGAVAGSAPGFLQSELASADFSRTALAASSLRSLW